VQATNHFKLNFVNADEVENKKANHLILEKIEESYTNLTDIDALEEEAGMDKEYVHKLRYASKFKLQELENNIKK